MKLSKFISAVLIFSSLSTAALAGKDLKYDLFEDWKQLGYLSSVEDTGPMSMSFRVQADQSDVYQNAVRVLQASGFIIDRKSDTPESKLVKTDWKTKPVTGFSSFMSGITAVRVKITVAIYGQGGQSNLQVAADVEVSDDNGWHAESSNEVRNDIRSMSGLILARPIYGDTDLIRSYLYSYSQADDPVLTKEAFWKQYGLSGFKAFPPDPSQVSATPPPKVVPPPTPALTGKIRFKELSVIAATKPLIISLAQDESQQKGIRLEVGGTQLDFLKPAFADLVTEVRRAEKLRETLKPGESEQGTTQKLGETGSWQTGAKVDSSKGNPFLLLLSISEGGTTQKIQLDKLQAKKLLEELDKCSAFLDSTDGMK